MSERLDPTEQKPMSNLSPELSEIVRSGKFKEWFGDWEENPKAASKMTDENGQPKVYYFGGPAHIEQLANGKRQRTGSDEIGFYVTEKPQYARFYAQAMRHPESDEPIPSSVYKVFVRAIHPYEGDDSETQRVTEKPEDYDAYINKKLQEVVVFDPEQILIVDEQFVNQ